MSIVPVWGCPYHGLIRGDQLELPNGESIDFPQPGGPWHLLGLTRRVAHPGAPALNRSPEQVAADDLAGRKWWREALLCGPAAQLHGKPLGSNSWIYIDPDGERWLASCTLNAIAGGARTLSLRRFGVFGAEPETFTYPFSQPDPGQGAPALGSLSLGITLVDSTSTGQRALFCIAATYQADTATNFPHCPVGWVEVALTGSGRDCTATATTVVTRSEALGEISEGHAGKELATKIYEPPDGGPIGSDPDIFEEVQLHFETNYPEPFTSISILGRVVGMMYSAEDVLSTVTVDAKSTINRVITSDTIVFTPTEFGGEFATVETETVEYSMHLDGAELDRNTVVNTRNCTFTVAHFALGDHGPYERGKSGVDWQLAVVDTYPDGSQLTDSDASIDAWDSNPATLTLYTRVLDVSTPNNAQGAARLPTRGINAVWGVAGNFRFYFLRMAMHCPGVYCLAKDITDFNSFSPATRTLGTACTTPAGPIMAPALAVTPADYAYGTWCPATEQLVRDTQPVCFT